MKKDTKEKVNNAIDIELELKGLMNEKGEIKRDKYSTIDIITIVQKQYNYEQNYTTRDIRDKQELMAIALKFFGGVEIYRDKKLYYLEIEKEKRGVYHILINGSKVKDLVKSLKDLFSVDYTLSGFIDLEDKNKIFDFREFTEEQMKSKIKEYKKLGLLNSKIKVD